MSFKIVLARLSRKRYNLLIGLLKCIEMSLNEVILFVYSYNQNDKHTHTHDQIYVQHRYATKRKREKENERRVGIMSYYLAIAFSHCYFSNTTCHARVVSTRQSLFCCSMMSCRETRSVNWTNFPWMCAKVTWTKDDQEVLVEGEDDHRCARALADESFHCDSIRIATRLVANQCVLWSFVEITSDQTRGRRETPARTNDEQRRKLLPSLDLGDLFVFWWFQLWRHWASLLDHLWRECPWGTRCTSSLVWAFWFSIVSCQVGRWEWRCEGRRRLCWSIVSDGVLFC